MAEEASGKAKGGGGGGFVIALLLLAVVGAGSGAGFSLFLLNGGGEPQDPDADKRKLEIVQGKAKKSDASGGHKGAAEVSKVQVASLDPILVALSGPQRAWARLELGVVIDGPITAEDNAALKSMTEDIMSFMRTVPLVHVESAAGIEYLREDIEEIARLRSQGRARSVILRSLVVE